MSHPRKDVNMNSSNTNRNGSTNGKSAGSNPSDPQTELERIGRGTTSNETAPRSLSDPFVDERDDVLSVINELEDQLDRNEQIRENLEREITRLTEEKQTSGQRVTELEWQIAGLQANIDSLTQLKQETALLEGELADSNTRTQRATEQVIRLEKDNTRLTEELKVATKQNEELWAIRKERDGLRGDLKSIRGRVEQLERANRELAEERSTLLSRLQETQNALEESRTERNQIEMNHRAAEDRTQELRTAIDALEGKLEDTRTERKALQSQIARLEREVTRMSEQQQFYEVEIASLRNVNRNSASALANVKKAFSEVRIALTETKSRARRRSIENLPRISATIRGTESVTADDGYELNTTRRTTNPTTSPAASSRDMIET